MKKLLNCKAILALAICLTMFAGLAITASAAPICRNCSKETVYAGIGAKFCSSAICNKTQTYTSYHCNSCGSGIDVCNVCGKNS